VNYPTADTQVSPDGTALQTFQTGFMWIENGQSGWCNTQRPPDKADQAPFCGSVVVPSFVPLPPELRNRPRLDPRRSRRQLPADAHPGADADSQLTPTPRDAGGRAAPRASGAEVEAAATAELEARGAGTPAARAERE